MVAGPYGPSHCKLKSYRNCKHLKFFARGRLRRFATDTQGHNFNALPATGGTESFQYGWQIQNSLIDWNCFHQPGLLHVWYHDGTTSVRLVANSNAGCGVVISNELTIEVYDETIRNSEWSANHMLWRGARCAIHHEHYWCQRARSTNGMLGASPSPLTTETNQTLSPANSTKPPPSSWSPRVTLVAAL